MPLNDTDGRDLIRAVCSIRDHADHYAQAMDYYWGRVSEVFGSPKVAQLLRGTQANFNVNFARRVVDVVLERVEIAAINAGEDDSLSQALRDRVWNSNKMGKESKKIHRTSLVCGDSYAIAWPGEDEGTVEIDYNSPLTTRVFYDQEHPKKKSFAAKMWCEGEKDKRVTRVNLYYADRVERYATSPGVEGQQASDFSEYGQEGEVWPIPNPFGEIPVFHFRTDDPYGHPEHEGAYGAQNAITKIIATEMDVTDQQAFKQRYLITKDPMGTLTTGASKYEVAVPGTDQSTLNPKERTPEFVSGPGKMHKFVGVDSVGEFEAADTGSLSDAIDHFLRMVCSATGTPMRFLWPQGDVPSGAALRADEAPLTSRIQDREEWWEETWVELLTFASSIVGLNIDNIDVQWKPVQVVDDVEGLNAQHLKRQLGVPADQLLREIGYLATTVAQWEADGLLGTQQPAPQEQPSTTSTIPASGQ